MIIRRSSQVDFAEPARRPFLTTTPASTRRSTSRLAPTISRGRWLRPGSAGSSEVRILFCFDARRKAILLVAGDKSGQWQDWYKRAIPLAELRYERWLAGEYGEEGT